MHKTTNREQDSYNWLIKILTFSTSWTTVTKIKKTTTTLRKNIYNRNDIKRPMSPLSNHYGGTFLKIQKWAYAINIQFTKIYNCWDSAWFLFFFPFLFRVFSEFSTPSKIYYSYIAKKKNLKIGTRRKNINLSFFSRNFSFLLQDCKAPLPAPNSESQNEQICKLTNNVLS